MAKNTLIEYDGTIREKILSGVEKLSKVVGSTMGPMGSNVVINRNNRIHCTKDGVTACRAVNSTDNLENIGIALVREASEKTNSNVGDGTSGSCVLAASIYRNGLKHLVFGANGIKIRNGIQKAADIVVNSVRAHSKSIETKEEIRQVAKISSNYSDEIADVLADVFDKIGQNGTIKVETGNSTTIESKIVEGMQFDRGYISPYFVTNDKMEADLDSPFIFIVDKKISNISEMLEPLQALSKVGRPIFIIADDIEGDALSTMVLNKLHGLQICAVKSPSYGQNKKNMLQDIAILTGGKVICEETGIALNQALPETGILGTAKRVIVTKETTTIIDGRGDPKAIQSRIDQLKSQIFNSSDEYDIKKMKERLARLDGGVGIISVGAKTESELAERKDLVDDAFFACKAAISGGIVPGGGIALINAARVLEKHLELNSKDFDGDEMVGAKILLKSLNTPLKMILDNAEEKTDLILARLESGQLFEEVGYDVLKKDYVNMIDNGIIDPTDVIVNEVQNAASVASLLLTTSSAIVEEESEKNGSSEQIPMNPYGLEM